MIINCLDIYAPKNILYEYVLEEFPTPAKKVIMQFYRTKPTQFPKEFFKSHYYKNKIK